MSNMTVSEYRTGFGVVFSDGSHLETEHFQDCCEDNYADFDQLADTGIEKEVFSYPLTFEKVDHHGFRFGNPGKMYFVPCYSAQNGYYDNTLDIIYKGEYVLKNLECEEIHY